MPPLYHSGPFGNILIPLILLPYQRKLVWLVRTAGLEPAPGFPKQILSLLRLPFRHVRSAALIRA